ncbi:hypothetical protein GGI07_005269 [Coemansia sp. Benny D115]|nr:hypothetical protein GGI07_005269 [Coemansia sp. Benny D115]
MWKLRPKGIAGPSEGVSHTTTAKHDRKLSSLYQGGRSQGLEYHGLRRTLSLTECDFSADDHVDNKSGRESSGYITDPGHMSSPHGYAKATLKRNKVVVGTRFARKDTPGLQKGVLQQPRDSAVAPIFHNTSRNPVPRSFNGDECESIWATPPKHHHSATDRPKKSLATQTMAGHNASLYASASHLSKSRPGMRALRQIFEPDIECDDGDDVFDALDSISILDQTSNPAHNYTTDRELHSWEKETTAKNGNSLFRKTADKHSLKPWSREEVQQLERIVKSTYADSPVNWDHIATQLGRTSIGCMTKYMLQVGAGRNSTSN